MAEKPQSSTGYKVKGVIDADEIPGWSRRPPKWEAVIQDIKNLGHRKTLVVSFESFKTARTAANTIRDRVNMRQELGSEDVVSTRVVRNGEGADVYFTRYHASEVTAGGQPIQQSKGKDKS